jgi:ubiquinone/menaquinone biosynthesis C-methylase UbiE
MDPKVNQVQSFFERPEQYLNRRSFEIRIRAETVRELVEHCDDMRILDIGCGDGSVSLPLLTQTTRLTLLDLSSNMLSIARSKIPRGAAQNIETLNQDFSTAQFEPQSFDLVLCVGVLAHVVSPADFIAKMLSLLRPGGSIILECTDSRHIFTRMFSLVRKVCGLCKPKNYPLNDISYSEIRGILERHRLQPKATFRYLAAFPGSHRLLSQKSLYLLTRRAFGTLSANRNIWLANECIGLFSSS